MQQRRKTAENTHKGYQMPQKKAVIPKNCFVTLNPKIENSIDGQKSSRSFRSTGFHFLSCGQNESLVIVYSFHVLLFIFMGHMEYARLVIISSSVGDLFQSWLFHLKISITEILL
jgi:hypothetical protein